MNKFLLAIILLMVPVHGWAASEEDVRIQYNAAVDRVYRRIMDVKENFPELSNFSRGAVQENAVGLKEITFTHKVTNAYAWSSEEDPYGLRFNLKVEELKATDDFEPEFPEWKFPALGLKATLEVYKDGELASFDPKPIVESVIEDLYLFAQDSLPFRLELAPGKAVYQPRESITITITLRNMGAQPFRVLDLDEYSLSCKIGDMTWGGESKEESEVVPEEEGEAPSADTVLPPYGTISKVLRVRGISEPKEAGISCRYAVGFKGVQPFARAKIRIQSGF
jgi:hypothetical protein